MKHRIRQIGAVMLTLLLLTSLVGAAAAISWDTETTNTGTQSDVSGSSNTMTWYADSSTETVYFEVSGAGTSDLTLELRNGAQEINTTYYTNSSAETVNSSNGHYAWNVTHSELRTELPSGYSGGTYDVVVINNSNDKEVLYSELTLNFNSSTTTARVMVENASRSADAIGNTLTADSLEVSTKDKFLQTFRSEENVSIYRDDVAIDGDNTTVEVDFTDSDARSTMEQASSGHDDGEWIHAAQFTVSSSTTDMKLAKVYLNEAPSETPDTYAVYDNSSKRVTLHTTEFNDAKELHVRGVANDGYSFGDLASAHGIGDALSASVPW